MDLRGKFNLDENIKPKYQQALHFRCKTCGAENTNMLEEHINWKARAIHAEDAVSFMVASMNDIMRSIEMYEGCAMNTVLKQVWKKKVRLAIKKLKNKEFRGD